MNWFGFISLLLVIIGLAHVFYQGGKREITNIEFLILAIFYTCFTVSAIMIHPLIGIMSTVACLGLVYITSSSSQSILNDNAMPYWLYMTIILIVIAVFSIGTVLEVVEVFSGRVF